MTASVSLERLGISRRGGAALVAESATLWLDPATTTRQAAAAIDQAARAGLRWLVFAGEEPTARGDFATLADRVARRGMRLGLRTDGRRLADPEVAAGAAGAWGLGWVDLCGRDLETATLQAAARSLVAARVTVAATVCAGPSAAAEIEALVAVEGLAELRIAPDAALVPSAGASQAAALVRRARAAGPADLSVRTIDLAVCLGGEGGAALPTPWRAEGLGPPVQGERVKPPACAGCAHHADCAGVSVASFRAFGDDALTPALEETAPQGASLRGVPQAAPVPVGFRPPEDSRLDVAPRYPDTALVTLMVPGCDLACVFCDTPQGDIAVTPSSLRGVRASLTAMANRASGVFFTGGEPTQLPWLFDALGAARDLGYRRVQMQSHAGPASEPAYAQALRDAGLTAIDVPIYGDNAETHQAVTHTPDSFRRTLAGMEALRRLGLRAVVHATLFRQNLPRLPQILRFIDSLAPDAAYLQVSGDVGPPGTYARVAPSPHDVGEALEAAFAAVTPTVPVWLADVTPCLVPSLASRVLSYAGTPEIEADPVVLPYGEWLMTFSRGTTRAHAPICGGCSLRRTCDGLPREALATFGASALNAR
jgi:MoaA/NifB/PqqE/SkfB family radical SAM enzyme